MRKIDIACIIDDDPIFVFATRRMMELRNFCNEFIVFSNGEEALNQLKQLVKTGMNIPDIILLDLNMPKMDGWEFLDAFSLMDCPKKITIFIVSSSINPVDMRRAKHYGSIGNYIIKPVSQQDLQVIIENSQPSGS